MPPIWPFCAIIAKATHRAIICSCGVIITPNDGVMITPFFSKTVWIIHMALYTGSHNFRGSAP
eukprot:14128825-Heterocapsa_arctica.AAC.1